MKFRSAFALAVLAAAATTAAHASDEPTAAGFWELQNDDGSPKAWFLFTDKDEVYSARLIKGFKAKDDDSPPQMICTKCPGEKKGAHVMGLTLFWGLKRDGLNYTDGSVIDPRDGSIYHAKMWFDEDGDGKTLHVRGFLGVSMLGKTQDWHRLPDDAMKTEDIPKEILAGGEVKHGDSPKHAAKPHKHKPKADGDAPTPAADPDAAKPDSENQ
jgi:uncharacterized protein (DUF2147 family)